MIPDSVAILTRPDSFEARLAYGDPRTRERYCRAGNGMQHSNYGYPCVVESNSHGRCIFCGRANA
jgi:hypothetical protein